MKRATAMATCVLAVALCAPTPALADGDPASDVLIAENVFYPFSPPVAPATQSALDAEAAAAKRAHFPIKVALIASPTDLGAIPSMFDKPQQYADFLDQEISFFFGKQPLLVVMPNGYGLQGVSAAAVAAAARLSAPTGRTGNDLAKAAIAAVPKIAAVAGHPIAAAPGGSDGNDGGGATDLGVGALVFVAVITSAGVLWYRRRRAAVT